VVGEPRPLARRCPVSRRKDLVRREAAELAPTNVVGQQIAAIVAELPRGIYRTHLTISRVELDRNGVEKSAVLVSSHCSDFEVRPAALPAAEPEPAPAEGDGHEGR